MQGPNPTEPANYRASYTRGSKEIVHREIAMYENAGIVGVDIVSAYMVIVATELKIAVTTQAR
jgi:hypothetical protein